MHIDAREHEPTEIETDLCIVGAGAAGITLALELLEAGIRVLLVESGGFERDAQTDLLNAGEHPSIGGGYLSNSRVRVFGGTTSHWTGFCLPLSDLTFTERPWVPDSGWPLDGAAMHPYYERAAARIDVDPWAHEGDPTPAPEHAPLQVPGFHTRVYQIRRGAHFGEWHRDTLVESEAITVMTHATCTQLHASERRVESIALRTPNEKTIVVRARAFVLATGGIENARLLLVSRDRNPEGLGNERGLVGRYYMDHPELVVGEALLWPGWDLELYSGHRRREDCVGLGALFTTVEQQREHGLLQGGVQVLRAGRRWGSEDTTAIDRALTTAGFWLDCTRSGGEGACLPVAQRSAFFVRSEQAPHPDNRVVLSELRDDYGVPLPKLEWSIRELDADSLVRTLSLLTRALHRDGLGRVRSFLAEHDLRQAEASFGFSVGDEQRDAIYAERKPLVLLWGHHMGTTRMSTDPAKGVVDPDGRLHGVDNLYLAGSSVFPTGGAANPTLTIVALALRLADHLGRALGRPA